MQQFMGLELCEWYTEVVTPLPIMFIDPIPQIS
jgi:hypothetical protein